MAQRKNLNKENGEQCWVAYNKLRMHLRPAQLKIENWNSKKEDLKFSKTHTSTVLQRCKNSDFWLNETFLFLGAYRCAAIRN